MVSFKLSPIVLALATITSALPAPNTNKPLSSSEFTLSLESTEYPVLTLNMQQASTLGNFDLVFQRPSAYSGTPAYLNNTRLDFDLTTLPSLANTLPGPYVVNFEDVGDNYGYKTRVTAGYDPGQDRGKTGFDFDTEGRLQAKRTAALQNFFACKGSYRGDDGAEVELLGLWWGVYQANGMAPEGCVTASLVKSDIVR